jgi:putative Holliday junction resolvase
MRVLAIDYGEARMGLAVSDLPGTLAGEAWVMEEWSMEHAAKRIAAEAVSRDVGVLVLGMPRNMDGTEGTRATVTREFAALLKAASGLEVEFWDERRSSVEAHAILRAGGKKTKKHRRTVDAVAAALILEGYLGRYGPNRQT